jgi:hypothetical protein
MDKEIILGKGIGNLVFGISPDKVIEILGEPDEKHREDFSDEDPDFYAEEWHYDSLELSLSFDMLEKLELSTISVSSDTYLLNGQKLISCNRAEVEKVINKMNLKGEWEEFNNIDEGGDLLSNELEGLSLWYEEDVLTEIQWEIV